MKCGQIFILLVIQVLCCSSKITDKQYLLMPTLFHLDDFDRCMMYGDEALYCMITFQLHPENPENTTEIWNIIDEVSSDPTYYRHDMLRHGVCIPDTCPNITKGLSLDDPEISKGLANCYNNKYKHLGLRGDIVHIRCENQESPYPIDIYDILVAICLIIYITFVICASFYEGIARYKSKEEYEKITGSTVGRYISAFSIPKNWYRLKSINTENPDVRNLRSIQGVRFYNMILVILTHTVMGNLGAPVSNPQYTEAMTEKVANMFLANGGFAVQTFFMISGWLLSYHFFVTFENKRDISPSYLLLAFINRYIRLTPTLAVVIALHSTWYVRMARGPFWDNLVGEEYRRCRKNWWANLLYINNYVDKNNMCLVQTWYMSNDTQFFVFGLLLCCIMWKYQKRIPLILGSIVATHIVVMFTIIYWNSWEAAIRPTPESSYDFTVMGYEKWHVFLGSTYSNIPGFVAGLSLGIIYYKNRHRNLFENKVVVFIWWLTTWGLGLGVVLVPGMIMYDKDYQHNRLFAALCGSTSRTLFSLGIGLAIFGYTQGIGWMTKWTTEWEPTYVLGRLTYGAYLGHTIFMRSRAGSRRSPTFLADDIMIYECMSDLSLGYLIGLFLTLLFEMPMTQLRKEFFPSIHPKVEQKEIKNGNAKKIS